MLMLRSSRIRRRQLRLLKMLPISKQKQKMPRKPMLETQW